MSPQRRDLLIFAISILVSFIGHMSVIGGLGYAARIAPPERRRPVEFTVIKAPEPEVEPEKPPPPPPPPPKTVEIEKPAFVEEPPASNSPDEDVPPEEVKPVFGISMSSVVGPGDGSGFRVRVGNTLMKAPDTDFTPLDKVQRYKKPISLHKVNKMPRKLAECKAEYPADAKALGIEGRVELRVEIRVDGTVGEVTVVKSLSHGLSAAASKALKKCKFSPAMMGGKPVPTVIPYTYTFIIED